MQVAIILFLREIRQASCWWSLTGLGNGFIYHDVIITWKCFPHYRPLWRESTSHTGNRYLDHFVWNCPHVNATRSHGWLVNTGSGNGLGLSGTKPLPEQCWPRFMLPYGITKPQCVKQSNCFPLCSIMTQLTRECENVSFPFISRKSMNNTMKSENTKKKSFKYPANKACLHVYKADWEFPHSLPSHGHHPGWISLYVFKTLYTKHMDDKNNGKHEKKQWITQKHIHYKKMKNIVCQVYTI